MTKVYLNKKITQRIASGHPWIYNNEIDRIAGTVEPGDLVEVYFLMANWQVADILIPIPKLPFDF